MRLQLVVQRHALPPVPIIYTTGTGPSSRTKSRDSTIADLLNDVNDLVPLESEDGEWGLEDYVVEVAATADQALTYECLHFQTCESALREDDEVIIRALSSEDLRLRRLGGRHQITSDGRHLIDGLAFGKQWLRKTHRPGIVIPPRKRRRLLGGEEGQDDEDEIRQILPMAEDFTRALVPFTAAGDEDEDDEDGDYVDEHEIEDNILQISVREEFDDADADSEDNSNLSGGESDGENDNLPAELELLLEDAAEIARLGDGPKAYQVLEKQLKRKRPLDDDGQYSDEENFEGFSTPVKGSLMAAMNGDTDSESDSDADSVTETPQQEKTLTKEAIEQDEDDEGTDSDMTSSSGTSSTDSDADSMMEGIATQQAEKKAKNIVEVSEDEDDSDSDASSASETSSSGSDAERLMDGAIEQAKKRALDLLKVPNDDSSDDSETDDELVLPKSVQRVDENETTSSSGSDSDSDSEILDDSNPETSDSSDSDSESGSGSESESEADGEEKKDAKKISGSNAGSSSTLQHHVPGLEQTKPPPTSAPGEGSKRTHINNDRTKKKKRLNMLKKDGILPEDADFKALAEYEQAQEQKSVQVDLHGDADIGENAVGEELHSEEKENIAQELGRVEDTTRPASSNIPDPPQTESQAMSESTPRRARLDLASSRRMVFSSLGLRTPKTPEAEQALREKLSKSGLRTRLPVVPAAGDDLPPQPVQTPVEEDESWKNKLIISAVECERLGVVLTPPPFPFQQGWTKPVSANINTAQRRGPDKHQYQATANQSLDYDENTSASELAELYPHGVQNSTLENGAITPKNADEESGGVPVPTDFENLPFLDPANVLPGAVIAYKELHVDVTTNYQPEVSSYRVGRVSRMDEDGTVHLTLRQTSMQSNKEAHDRLYGTFVLDEDADAPQDDGLRQTSFSNMISARLMQPSSVEVPESGVMIGLRGGQASVSSDDGRFAVIPETAEGTSESQQSELPRITVLERASPSGNESTTVITVGVPMSNSAFTSRVQIEPFDSPIDETSQPQEEDFRFQKRLPSEDRPSFDFYRHSPPSVGEKAAFLSTDSRAAQSSSPIIHTQETVEYPHISQMEIYSSGIVPTANSSSHQDAQKVSPAPAVELSFSLSESHKAVGNAENEGGDSLSRAEQEHFDSLQTPPSLPSEKLPSSQDMGNDTNTPEPRRSPFLGGRGFDGQDSSYHDDEASDEESDDLPSLQEIVSSSQQFRRQTRASSGRVSPPATKTLRSSKKVTNSTPPSSPELPPSSEPSIKLSQSQKPRLSRIPPGSQIIELSSSAPGSPSGGSEEVSSGGLRSGSQINGTKRHDATTRKQPSGVGTRKLLTRKKTGEYF